MSKDKKNIDKLHKLGLVSDKAKQSYEANFLKFAETEIEKNKKIIKSKDIENGILFFSFNI